MCFRQIETALLTDTGNGYLITVTCGIAVAALCVGALIALMCRQRITDRSASGGLNMSTTNDAMRHEEEKSNNLQNEENFRRYANPLKGSVTSLRGVALELSLTPAGPEMVPVGSDGGGGGIVVGSTLAGPSAIHHNHHHHRSQPLYPSCDADFPEAAKGKKELPDNPKAPAHHRSSQILLYKAQNADMRKNTVGSIDSPHKDFGKRAINCQPQQPQTSINNNLVSNSNNSNLPIMDTEVLTVHV